MDGSNALPAGVEDQAKAAEGTVPDYFAMRRAQQLQPTIGGVRRPNGPAAPAPENKTPAQAAGAATDPNQGGSDRAGAPAAAGSGDGKSAQSPGGEAPQGEAKPGDGDGRSDKPGEESSPPQAADGDGQTEKAGGDGKTDEPGDPAEFPPWVTKRLNRDRRKIQRAHKAELDTRNAEITQLRAENTRLQNRSQPPPAAAPAPAQGTERLADYYPERRDYTDPASYNAAIRVWEKGAEVQGFTAGMTEAAKARFGEAAPAAAPAAPAPAKEPSGEERYNQWFNALAPEAQQKEITKVRRTEARRREILSLLDDTYDLIEEQASLDLSEAFRSGVYESGGQSQIKVSKAMLDYMAESDGTHVIVKAFVEKPRLSRAIARKKTQADQVAALKRLANGTQKAPAKADAQPRTATAVPDLDDTVSSRGKPNLPAKAPHELSQSAYNAMRRKQERRGGTGVVA